jgi:hypothetical protein
MLPNFVLTSEMLARARDKTRINNFLFFLINYALWYIKTLTLMT